MADTISPMVRLVVGKVHVGTPEEEVVDYFWSRIENRGNSLSEKQREDLERQVRKCHQENIKMSGRIALGFLD